MQEESKLSRKAINWNHLPLKSLAIDIVIIDEAWWHCMFLFPLTHLVQILGMIVSKEDNKKVEIEHKLIWSYLANRALDGHEIWRIEAL